MGAQPGVVLSLRLGMVVNHVAGLQCYDVATDAGVVRAVTTSDAGGFITGTRGGGQIPIGTYVVVAADFARGSATSYIIGAIRSSSYNPALAQADHDVLVPNAGYVWDALHKYLPVTQPHEQARTNANDGTPLDALGGEWGKYNPMGAAIHVGNFMSFLRAGDRTGVWAFTIDELLRLCGRSVELLTLGRQMEERVDDAGELNGVDRRAFLPWEALGLPTAEACAQTTDERQDDTNAPPERAPIEPQEVDQVGIFRDHRFTGFLADLDRQIVSCPAPDQAVNRLSKADEATKTTYGLSQIVRSADGSVVVQSAKSLVLEKYSAIPVPLERHLQQSPDGDTLKNAKFNGVNGEGTAYPRKDYRFDDQPTPAARPALGLELHGFRSIHGRRNFRGRTDWSAAQEGDSRLTTDLGGSAVYPDFKLDPQKYWMDLPKYKDLTIQADRWEGVRYYASRSALELLDDGSVVIEDGYGGQIILSGGNLLLTAPNDIVLAPGRNLIALAPQDLVMRVGQSADLTTSRGDIRMKAERNLQVVAANSGEGALLLESRADDQEFKDDPGERSDYRGLVLRATTSTICHVAKDEIHHTLSGGKYVIRCSGALQVLANDALMVLGDQGLTLAVGDGSSDFNVTNSQNLSIYQFAADEVSFGLTRQISRMVLNLGTYTAGSSDIRGLFLDGSLIWNGTGVWNASIDAQMNMRLRGGIDRLLGGNFGELTNAADQQIDQVVQQAENASTLLYDTRTSEITDSLVDSARPFKESSTLFNRTDVEARVAFSLRTAEDYHLEGDRTFALPQWRWQQYARLSGSGSTWEEPEVEFAGDGYLPWPGKSAWTEEERHLTSPASSTFFNGKTAVDEDAVDDQQTSEITRRILAESYTVNTF